MIIDDIVGFVHQFLLYSEKKENQAQRWSSAPAVKKSGTVVDDQNRGIKYLPHLRQGDPIPILSNIHYPLISLSTSSICSPLYFGIIQFQINGNSILRWVKIQETCGVKFTTLENADSGDGSVSRFTVRTAVLTVLDNIDPTELKDDSDFFSLGLDSMKVVSVVGLLEQEEINWVDRGTIYKNPTIETLIACLRRGSSNRQLPANLTEIFRMIDKYSCFYQRAHKDIECSEYLKRVEAGTEDAYPEGRHVVTLHHLSLSCLFFIPRCAITKTCFLFLIHSSSPVPLAPLEATSSPSS